MRWQVFTRPINMLPENAQLVVQAAVVLHNFLHEPGVSASLVAVRLNPTAPLPQPLPSMDRFGFRSSDRVRAIRDAFATYFRSQAGALPFDQDEYQLLQ